MKSVPRSPFTTPLSRSARETEPRIRGILPWKKQRPPLLAPVLAALILSCGGLAACQAQGGTPSDMPAAQSGEAWSTQAVLDALFQSSDASILSPDSIQGELLDSQGTSEDLTLAAGHFNDDYPRYSLVISMVDRAGQVAGTPFEASGSGGQPYTAAFEKDGSQYMLYTANFFSQGYSGGEAGVIRLDGDDFTWVWPVEGDVRDSCSQAYKDYYDYWKGRKPLLAPGGLDLFEEDPKYSDRVPGSRQWIPTENRTFWSSREEELPTGVLWQTRMWMEEHLPQYVDSYPGSRLSATWQMVSLIPETETYPDRDFEGTAVYTLTARMDGAPERIFTADLCFDHGGGGVTGVLDYHETVQGEPVRPEMDKAFYTLLRDWFDGQYPNDWWYFVSDQPKAPREGDLRMGPVLCQGAGSTSTRPPARSTQWRWPAMRMGSSGHCLPPVLWYSAGAGRTAPSSRCWGRCPMIPAE